MQSGGFTWGFSQAVDILIAASFGTQICSTHWYNEKATSVLKCDAYCASLCRCPAVGVSPSRAACSLCNPGDSSWNSQGVKHRLGPRAALCSQGSVQLECQLFCCCLPAGNPTHRSGAWHSETTYFFHLLSHPVYEKSA